MINCWITDRDKFIAFVMWQFMIVNPAEDLARFTKKLSNADIVLQPHHLRGQRPELVFDTPLLRGPVRNDKEKTRHSWTKTKGKNNK